MRHRPTLNSALIAATLVAGPLQVHAATTYTFQEGVNGYTGTKDTQIRFGSPDRDDGALDSLNLTSRTGAERSTY